MKSVLVLSIIFCFTSLILSQKPNIDGPVVGIDLGTTYSCVGIFKNGKVEIIPNELGNRITPSVVAFTDDERLVGEAAKNQAAINPKRTIYSIKRLIGRKYSDKEVQHDKKLLPYEIVSVDGKPYVQVEIKGQKKNFSPEEVSSFILTKMKQIAENYLGREVKHAVVTVPAYFNDSQRQSTKDAGVIAGLTVLRIINEPTAAAIAYGLDKRGEEKNILVYDLGGGTFDVSLLTINQGVFEVISTNGDTHLGGDDFDNRVLDYLMKLVKKRNDKDIGKSSNAMQKLKSETEKAKRFLSSTTQASIEIDDLVDGVDFKENLSRAKFEELNADLFKKTLEPCNKVLEDAGMKKTDISEVVLVGGSTRIPKVQALIKEYFNGKEPHKGINPDEAVAFGAAVQGGILGGEALGTNEVVLIDVTPLSLGIETIGGVMSKIIPRGSVIPTKKSEIYTTVDDKQTILTVTVYEGERPMVKDNHKLGEFDLTGIPPAPRGTPEIEVTFEVDENSILKVIAVEKATGNKKNLTITNDKGRLSKEEIEKMVRDAETYAEQDKKTKEKISVKLNLEHYLNSMQSTIDDKEGASSKLSEVDKETLISSVKEHRDWLDKSEDADKSDYETHLKDLQSVCDPIIKKIYKGGERPGDNFEEQDL